jgi:hypothetical protein
MAVLVAIETAMLALLTLLVAGLLRSHAEILRRLHEMGAGLDPGAADAPAVLRPRGRRTSPGLGAAHDVAGAGLHDAALLVPIVGVGHRTLLAFLSSGCLTCRTFWDAFADAEALQLPADIRIVVVAKDASEEHLHGLRELAAPDLPVVLSSDAWADYDVPGSPYFVLADGATGRVLGEGTGMSWPQVLGLLTQANYDDDALARDDLTTNARMDQELMAAGIQPGDSSLYATVDTNDGGRTRT